MSLPHKNDTAAWLGICFAASFIAGPLFRLAGWIA